MLDAIMLCAVYIGPFVVLITAGAFMLEVVIPAAARRRARRRRYGKSAR